MNINETIQNSSQYPVLGLGIRFRPIDEDLIHYLLKFVTCKNFTCDNIQLEDLYGNKKPWEIFEDSSSSSRGDEDTKKVKYFLTKLKRKKSDSLRLNCRLIGGGSWWKGLDRGKAVYKGSKLVGIKKSYRYEEDGDQVNNIVWNMKEYSLDQKILKVLRQQRLIKHEDCVLCCIKRKIVHAHDHKESRNCMPVEFSRGNDVDAVMKVMHSTTLKHDLDCVTSSSEDQGTNSHDFCPNSDQFTSSFDYNAFHELQQDQNSEQVISQVLNIEEMAPFAQSHIDYVSSSSDEGTANFHDPCALSQFTSSDTDFQLQLQDNNVECDTRATVSSTLVDQMMNNIDNFDRKEYEYLVSSLPARRSNTATPSQFPICIDESGYDHHLHEQIVMCPVAQGSAPMVLNEGNNAALFMPDQWSTFCQEQVNQVQNLEETTPITFTDMIQSSDYSADPTTALAMNRDMCFSIEELLGSDNDVIAADFSWQYLQD